MEIGLQLEIEFEMCQVYGDSGSGGEASQLLRRRMLGLELACSCKWSLLQQYMAQIENCKDTGERLLDLRDKLCVARDLNGKFHLNHLSSILICCRIPSALWQLFWCCIYGPYLLYKIRNVHDTHHWRTQTILCIVSGYGPPLCSTTYFSHSSKLPWRTTLARSSLYTQRSVEMGQQILCSAYVVCLLFTRLLKHPLITLPSGSPPAYS